jgi:hypothetical protein
VVNVRELQICDTSPDLGNGEQRLYNLEVDGHEVVEPKGTTRIPAQHIQCRGLGVAVPQGFESPVQPQRNNNRKNTETHRLSSRTVFSTGKISNSSA